MSDDKGLNPLSAPIRPEDVALFNRLTESLGSNELAWLGGYLTGLSKTPTTGERQSEGEALMREKSGSQAVGAIPETPKLTQSSVQAPPKATVLYGSQTGNAESVAKNLYSELKAANLEAELVDMADAKAKTLSQAGLLLAVVSTHGEGEPPDPAEELHELIQSKKAPKLSATPFAVLSLGDSSYDLFCQTGKDFDERFATSGGKRLLDRVDLDVDFEDGAEAWIKSVVEKIKSLGAVASGNQAESPVSAARAQVNENNYTRKAPLEAEVLEKTVLSGRGSNKETLHLEIGLEGSGLRYEPGDALAILPSNKTETVEQILQLMNWSDNEQITIKGESYSLKEALLERVELCQVNKKAIQNYAALDKDSGLYDLVKNDDSHSLASMSKDSHWLDIIRSYPSRTVKAQDFIDLLKPMAPRLYSIASSQSEVDEEVHLTVGVVRYELSGEPRGGVCTSYLADGIEAGDKVRVYVQKNNNFRLPANGDQPVIMIGPGTGIAPFRAFIQEREAQDHKGKNWLFFGEQHFTTDFYYQTEWQKYLEKGILNKIDLAFSRDQKEKIYVQDRIWEKGEELFQWLEEGASVYICGDAKRMAKDVQVALVDVITTHGNRSREEAEAYLSSMKKEKRYLRDVY